MRLDKYLANCGYGSRSQLKKLIKNGSIKVNDITVTDASKHIKEDDVIKVDNDVVNLKKYVYFLLNKPKGVISATKDKNTTVIDLIDEEYRYRNIFPVGRLDKDTTGLMLITDNGELAHDWLSPKKHIEKKYLVYTDNIIENKEYIIEIFRKGILLLPENKITKKSTIEFINESNIKCYRSYIEEILNYENNVDDYAFYINNIEELKRFSVVTITEGKYHQVKRMYDYVGYKVVDLKRLSMGKLWLPNSLKPGQYIELEEKSLLY